MLIVIIGCVKEIKANENRVGLIPGNHDFKDYGRVKGVVDLAKNGHEILLDWELCWKPFKFGTYRNIPSRFADSHLVYQLSELLVKVKEPIGIEYGHLGKMKAGAMLFAFLHLTGSPRTLTELLLKNNITAIDYSTVRLGDELPILKPMSIIAGELAVSEGMKYLKREPKTIAVIGGGNVGESAVKSAMEKKLGVIVLEKSEQRRAYLQNAYPDISVRVPDETELAESVRTADIVVGAVLSKAGAKPPKVVTKQMVRSMKKGSVIVDVAIDQGGCIEGSRPTTYDQPVYMEDGIKYYCVTNIPGGVPERSLPALANATIEYVLSLADNGLQGTINKLPGFKDGINTYNGKLTNKTVAETFGMEYTPLEELIDF
jgi:alanine dehydrogenase